MALDSACGELLEEVLLGTTYHPDRCGGHWAAFDSATTEGLLGWRLMLTRCHIQVLRQEQHNRGEVSSEWRSHVKPVNAPG
jgi:hypothetical protein